MAHWDALAALVLQIEGVCTQYAVPVATIDGKALAQLCAESGVHSALFLFLLFLLRVALCASSMAHLHWCARHTFQLRCASLVIR